MTLRKSFLIPGIVFVTFALHAQDLTVSPDKADGVYGVGDTVHWTIHWKGQAPAPEGKFQLLSGGRTEIGSGSLVFADNAASVESKFVTPDTVLLKVNCTSGKSQLQALGGAVAAPEKIGLSAPRPADFDAFWKEKVAELEKVPANPQLETIDIKNPDLSYWKITLDNIRETHIHGQLARPSKGEKFPALLIVQWAGVYPLKKEWVTDRAKQGWLTLNIEAHDLPIDAPESFYKAQRAGALKDYPYIGNDDRETSYFLRMYLSCYQAAEYLTHRDDWDGKTFVVTGDSQGGLQTLMLAGLHPDKITAAMALVPAGCDMLGPDLGRAPGWPQWYFKTSGKNSAKVREASRYYDVANFTPLIKCPVLVGLGLIDETCPPAGVLAAANQITSPKEVVILPVSGHNNKNGSQDAYNDRRYKVWLPALHDGKPAPVNPKTEVGGDETR